MAKSLSAAIDFDHLSLYDQGLRGKVAKKTEIPKNVSELQNDRNYQTNTEVTNSINTALEDYTPTDELPENLSDFNNDEDYQSGTEVDTKISDALQSYTPTDDLPENLSDFYNDQDFQSGTEVDTKISEALQSSGFQTGSEVDAAIQAKATEAEWQSLTQVTNAINEAIKDVVGVKFEVVQELPGEGKPGVIYLKKSSIDGGDYAEYIWIETDSGGIFEMLGTAGNVDLTGYVKQDDITVASNSQITGLLAGWE